MHSHIKLNAIESYSYIFYYRDVKKTNCENVEREIIWRSVFRAAQRLRDLYVQNEPNKRQKWDGETVS